MSSSSTSNPTDQFGPNEWLVEEMYQRFLEDPDSVDPAWHEFFADYRPGDASPTSGNAAQTAADTTAAPSPLRLRRRTGEAGGGSSWVLRVRSRHVTTASSQDATGAPRHHARGLA